MSFIMPEVRPFEYRDGFAFFSCAAMEFLRKHPNYYAAFLPVAPTVDEKLIIEGLDSADLAESGHRQRRRYWRDVMGRDKVHPEEQF